MVKLAGAVVLTVCGIATACLITNCPKGGKRSKISPDVIIKPQRTCVQCGPGQLGHCLGPSLCCGPHLGCLMAAPGVLLECEGTGSLYQLQGRPCLSPTGFGICASDGVCCDQESCHIDLTCEIESSLEICPTEEITLERQF